jgi:hypothetical protein
MERLWFKILENTYGVTNSCLHEGGNKYSMWWKVVFLTLKAGKMRVLVVDCWFSKHLSKMVEVGRDTLFRYNPWLTGEGVFKDMFSRLFSLATN